MSTEKVKLQVIRYLSGDVPFLPILCCIAGEQGVEHAFEHTCSWYEKLSETLRRKLIYFFLFCFSVLFIHHYFKSAPHLKPLRGLLPSPLVLAGFALSWVITVTSEARLCCNHGWLYRILHIGIGGVCLLAVTAFVFIKEKTLVNFMLEHWLGRKKKKEE